MAEPEELPEPVAEWEAKADAAHAAIMAEVGDPEPVLTLTMLKRWKSHAQPANALGQISFSRAMLDSATDALEFVLGAARDALVLLDSYGPDDEQEDDDFVSVRARLRAALKPPAAE